MNNSICICSSASLRYKGPFSFSVNDYIPRLNDTNESNPLLCTSSFQSLPCCCCSANSLHNRIPITKPIYLYRLAASRLFYNAVGRFCYGRFPICDVDRSCFCEKDCILKGKSVCRKGGKIGKGRFRSMVFEEKSEWDGFSDSVGADEAEVMLSLLTEDVSEECNYVLKRRGQSCRKIEIVKGSDGGDGKARRRKKIVFSSVFESRSEFEYESKMIRSKGGEMRRKEDYRSGKEDENLMRRQNVKLQAEDERDNSIREISNVKLRDEERMNLSRANQKDRFRIEERGTLSTREDHRQRVKKDGSSCSSCNSFSSGDFEIDNEIQDEQEYEEDLSRRYVRGSKKSEGLVSHEVREDVQRHGKDSREQGLTLRKENAEAVASPSSVEYGWRKKSEKKLSDFSVQEIKHNKESAEKQSRYGEVHKGNYGKTVGSDSTFDEKKLQSTLTVNFDEDIGERNEQMIENETGVKSKQFSEISKTLITDVKTSTSGNHHHVKNESSSESQSSVWEESSNSIAVERKSREAEHMSYGQFTESKYQKDGISGTSTSVRQSGIRIKNQEVCSKATLNNASNIEGQRHQSSKFSGLLDSRKRLQQLTGDMDSEKTSVLRMESDTRMKKHEVNPSSVYQSHHQLRDQSSEMIRKHSTIQGSSAASPETMDLSVPPYSNTNISVVDDGPERTDLVLKPPSQLVVRGSIHVDSASASATKETADERLHGAFTASHRHTLDRSQGFHYQSPSEARRDEKYVQTKFISQEDALGSADRSQKSSLHYVGEFVQNARNEISSSDLHEVKKTYGTESVHEDEQHDNAYISSYSSGIPQSKEQDSKSSSHGSGRKVPSDRIWDIAEPSNLETPEAEAIGNERTSGKAVVRRSGTSLWHIIGDIFHLRWHSHSETRSSATKSGGKSSPNQSTSSETWFSGQDPEENIDVKTKGDRISSVEESTNVDQLVKVSSQSQGEVFSSSSSQGDKKQRGAASLTSSIPSEKDSLIKRISLPSGESTYDMKLRASFPETGVTESSLPLPSLEIQVLPVVDGKSVATEGEGSGIDNVVQINQPVPITLSGKSRQDAKHEELKRRKLGRNDQVAQDRFDEWEEAYRLETEQRRLDEMFMREALLEARKAADSWEVPVGAVLVQDGKIIARGYNLVEELRDSTAHAEMNCIREASNILRTWRLSETTLYVTLEPCPMCAGAILQARIDTVVWGAPNKLLGADGGWIRLFPNGEGGNGLDSTDKPAAPVHPFHPKIVVRRCVLAAECADTMQQFFQLRRKKGNKKPEPSPSPSGLPISRHPSKFLTKMHDVFHIMFCL